jgi:hypothetical protein
VGKLVLGVVFCRKSEEEKQKFNGTYLISVGSAFEYEIVESGAE